MGRDLKILTLDNMLEMGIVYFYERDIDYDTIREGLGDTSINIDFEVELCREQQSSDMIHDLTLEILKASGNEIKPLNYIFYYCNEGIVLNFKDNTDIFIENDIVLKGIYKFFKKEYGLNKKDLTINTLKGTQFWEVGIGTDFDCDDIRINCCQFLLEATFFTIDNNLMCDEWEIL